MVIARCPKCLAASRSFVEAFRTSAEPVGYPNSALVCGIAGCNELAIIWLRGTDALEYRAQQKVCFVIANNKAKVLVKPPRGQIAETRHRLGIG